jgi:UDP-N-acetylmuramoylalanine--D-glutamate ligase
VLDLRTLERLRGRHNHQNAAVAYAAARALGLASEEAARGFPTFVGLPHRLEEVAKAGGVRFVNDSKATNPDAAARALESFDAIFWIAGGKPKPGGFASLRPQMRAVRRAFLIGEAADEIERDLGDLAPVERSGTLGVAIEAAARAARASGLRESVILLAPACASYDQFANFEERGDRFRELARTLAAGAAA